VASGTSRIAPIRPELRLLLRPRCLFAQVFGFATDFVDLFDNGANLVPRGWFAFGHPEPRYGKIRAGRIEHMSSIQESPRRKRRRHRRRAWWRLSLQDTLPTPEPIPPGDAPAAPDPHRRRRSGWRISAAGISVVIGAAVLAGIAVGKIISDRTQHAVTPVFHRVSFERGIVRGARFAEDGAVVYSAAWDDPSLRLYITRLSASASTLLDLPPAHLFSISRSNELAVSLDHAFDGVVAAGTLARVPLGGSRPVKVADNVRDAEWTPDGSELVIIRRLNGRDRLEWPEGRVLYTTTGFLSTPRFSSDGARLAFADHPVFGVARGDIVTIDAMGNRNALVTNLPDIRGLSWAPGDGEVWFAAATEDPQAFATLQAVNMSGRRRTVMNSGVDLTLMDIDRTGRVLLSGEARSNHIEAWMPGDETVRDLSSADAVDARAVSGDGREILITRRRTPSVLIRRSDRNDVVPLGEGEGFDLSADGQMALAIATNQSSRVLRFTLAGGEVAELPNPAALSIVNARILPGNERVVLLGGRPNEPWRGYVQEMRDGVVTRFTRPGVSFLPSQMMAVTPDGEAVALRDAAGRVQLFPIAGGDPVPIRGLADGEYPVAWADAHTVFVTRGTAPPWHVDRLDLATGTRMPWREFKPLQTIGIDQGRLIMSADGNAMVQTYSQVLSNLFVVDGLY
jgi:hypothetical protein